jgi:hypothetical protein
MGDRRLLWVRRDAAYVLRDAVSGHAPNYAELHPRILRVEHATGPFTNDA